MSIEAINWAFNQKIKTKGKEKLILLALANYANEDGFCYPSIETLCQKTSSCRQAVCQGIKSLIKAKLIKKTNELTIPLYYRKNQNVYKLLVCYSDSPINHTSMNNSVNQYDSLTSTSMNTRHKPS